MSTDSTTLGTELLALLQTNDEGLSDEQISAHFGSRYPDLVPVINDLLAVNRLQLLTQGDILFYRIVQEETAAKFEGLGPEQILVYQICERAGNKGIWTRDIKTAANVPQHTLTKTLKTLEQRSLLKSVRSVTSKSKKLYMLFDTIPAKEITGGPWYTDQEFDSEFLEALCNFIVQFVKSHPQGMCDIDAINDQVRISGISKVELSIDELELVLQTLVYDGRLEDVKSSVLILTNKAASSGKTIYKASKKIMASSHLTESPCGACPVIAQCTPGGIISPTTCQYFQEWLAMDDMQF
jgi:DNA-directed RNA polymerase III subunit RPC6